MNTTAMSSISADGSEAEHAEGCSASKDVSRAAGEDSDSETEQTKAVENARKEEEEAQKQENGAEEDEQVDKEWPNLGSSITERGRKRIEWAGGTLEGKDASYWVCSKEDCRRELCKLHREYLNSRELLKQSRVALAEAQQSLADATSSQEGVSDMDVRIAKLLEDSVAIKEAIVADKEAIVAGKKTILKAHCLRISDTHIALKETLLHGKSAGNKTDHQTLQTNREQALKEAGRADAELEEARAEEARANANADATVDLGPNKNEPKSPSLLHQCFNEECTSYSIDDKKIENNVDLKEFYNFCDLMFSKSITVKHNYGSKEFDKCIEQTCRHITDWQKGTTVGDKITYYRPSGKAQETKAVQPILFALMWKIARILGGTMHLTREQYLPKENEKSKRWMDANWCDKVKQHLGSAKGGLLGKSVEMKPLSRKNNVFAKMVNGGENQEIGHMFQTLWDGAFQYCRGLGRDGRASGMVLTMASAKLLEVEISHVGTPEVNLTSRSTGNHPLFSENTSKVLFKGGGAKRALYNSGLVFAGPPEGGVMQKGFVNLVHFVMDLGNEEEEDQANAKIELKDDTIELKRFLGAGAFCSVHEACASRKAASSEDVNLIVKIAKDEEVSCRALKNELSVLQVLEHLSIPKLYRQSLVDLEIEQRCERNRVQGLILKARVGETAGEACKTTGFLKCIDRVFTETSAALDHAHGKKIVHLDVQPSNIIILQGAEPIVLLNDWGCAAWINKLLTYYKGSPPFSPDDLLRTNSKKFISRKPVPKFDMFSLAMTICYLLNGGMPWDGFNRPLVTQEMLDTRKKKAKSLINASTDLSQEIKDRLLLIVSEKCLKREINPPQSKRKAEKKEKGSSSKRAKTRMNHA